MNITTATARVRVWDTPTRLFHWTLALLIAFSYVSSQLDWMQLHFLSGYAILALLLFRLAWGVIGSQTARFASFVTSPLAGIRHLARFRDQEPDLEIGHNAAGGWMVLVMLLALCVQAGTGLFANDDGVNDGPLFPLVGKALSDQISSVHSVNWNLIMALIALHLVAIASYALVKRHDLVRPMVTGWKTLPADLPRPRLASSWLALAVLAVAAGIAWRIAAGP